MRSSNKQSPSPHHVLLAQILREHGIKGELKALPLSPALFRLKPGDPVIARSGNAARTALTVGRIRQSGRFAIVSFSEIADRDAAALLRNHDLAVTRDLLPKLPEGEYYRDEIIGLAVLTTHGEAVGTITDIFNAGSSDVYVVRQRRRQYLIPAIREVVREIDLAGQRMVIEPMEGLLD